MSETVTIEVMRTDTQVYATRDQMMGAIRMREEDGWAVRRIHIDRAVGMQPLFLVVYEVER